MHDTADMGSSGHTSTQRRLRLLRTRGSRHYELSSHRELVGQASPSGCLLRAYRPRCAAVLSRLLGFCPRIFLARAVALLAALRQHLTRPCSGYYRPRDAKIRRRWDDPASSLYTEGSHTSPSPSTTSTPRCPLGPGFPQSWVRALMLQKGGSSRLLRLRECAAQFYPLRGEKCQDSRTQVVVRLHSHTVPASNSLGPAKVAVHSLGRPPPFPGWLA